MSTCACCGLALPSKAMRAGAEADDAGAAAPLAACAATLAASVNAAGADAGHCTPLAFSVRPSKCSAAAGFVEASFHRIWLSAISRAPTRTSHGAAEASGALAAEAAGAARAAAAVPPRSTSTLPSASRSRCHCTPSSRIVAKASLRASGCTSARPTRACFHASRGAPEALFNTASRADTQPFSATLGALPAACVNASERSADNAPPASRTGSESGR